MGRHMWDIPIITFMSESVLEVSPMNCMSLEHPKGPLGSATVTLHDTSGAQFCTEFDPAHRHHTHSATTGCYVRPIVAFSPISTHLQAHSLGSRSHLVINSRNHGILHGLCYCDPGENSAKTPPDLVSYGYEVQLADCGTKRQYSSRLLWHAF